MLDTQKASVIDLDGKISPIVLAGILGINVSLVYQNAQAGIIPTDFINYSYREILQQYIKHYKKGVDVKIAKEESERAIKLAKEEAKAAGRRSSFSMENEVDGDIHPLMAAKIKQAIKTEYAREAQLWQSIAIKNEEYVSFTTKLSLVQPFILHIRDLLLGVALDFPETQSVIDEGMESLFNLGKTLIEEVEIDRDSYISDMLERDIE